MTSWCLLIAWLCPSVLASLDTQPWTPIYPDNRPQHSVLWSPPSTHQTTFNDRLDRTKHWKTHLNRNLEPKITRKKTIKKNFFHELTSRVFSFLSDNMVGMISDRQEEREEVGLEFVVTELLLIVTELVSHITADQIVRTVWEDYQTQHLR